jgi:hypothetical protein
VFLSELARDLRESLRERGSTRLRRPARRFEPGTRRGSIPAGGDEAAVDRRSAEELKRRLDDTRERLKRDAPDEPA